MKPIASQMSLRAVIPAVDIAPWPNRRHGKVHPMTRAWLFPVVQVGGFPGVVAPLR